MTDVLVRDVPEAVIAALDAQAARMGVSRSELLRRNLARDAARGSESVTAEHLVAFGLTFADLADDRAMTQGMGVSPLAHRQVGAGPAGNEPGRGNMGCTY